MPADSPMPAAGRLASWRADRTLAHCVPLILFLLLQVVPGLVATRNPLLPWYERAPEQWVYPLQTVLCGLLVVWWWRAYQVRVPKIPVLLAAVAVGVAGIAVWILPCELFHRLGLADASAGFWKYLGVQARSTGFDPHDAPWPAAALAVRMVRMVVVVAVIEEVFWRGFLMRWLADLDRPVWSVPFGTHHWRALAGTLVGVVIAHQPPDYAAAAVWGLLLYGLAVATRSLGACIVAHAVANLLLGIYVIGSGHYGFW